MNAGTVCAGTVEVDLHHERRAQDRADRREIAGEIEVEVSVERHVDGLRRRGHQQRVAVCRCAHDGFGPDIGGRAWAVLDHEGLAKPFGQPLTDQARDQIGVAGGWERHDHPHRP